MYAANLRRELPCIPLVVEAALSPGRAAFDSSAIGEAKIPCVGKGEVRAQITAKAFCSLITTRYREKVPSGLMKLIFRPGLREVAIDAAGIKAKFSAPN